MKYTANPVEVTADVISGVGPNSDDGTFSIFLENGDNPEKQITVTPEMAARYHPSVGDYYVVQSDGYAYLNPKTVFERKYRYKPNPVVAHVPTADAQSKVENNFTYHAPNETQPARYTALRDAYKGLALMLLEQCPNSRELSVALTELEASCFWANAAIARNE